MLTRLKFLVIVICLLLNSWTLAQDANPEGCEGVPESRLSVGDLGRVLPGTPNNLRAEPDIESALVGAIRPDTVFMVVAGPECAGDYAWWLVGFPEGIGWTVENVDEQGYAVEPVESTVTEVDYGGLIFQFDSRVAPSILGQVVPAYNQSDTSLLFWSRTPSFINFALGQNLDNPGTLAQFAVFPTQLFSEIQRTTAIDDLRQLLQDRPENPTPVGLPILNADRVLFSQPKYIDFDGGSGLRFVAYFSQAADPLTSRSLSYVFQGVTDQGEHYIQINLPILTGLLPPAIPEDFNYDEFITNYPTYLEDIQKLLDEANDSDFAPSLGTLDELVLSLQVDSQAVSATLAGDTTFVARCTITAIADSRLRVAPDVESDLSDYLPANIPVPADGQYQRRGEPFPWWRLASKDEVRPLPDIPSFPGDRWVRADFTREEGNCAGLPVISQP